MDNCLKLWMWGMFTELGKMRDYLHCKLQLFQHHQGHQHCQLLVWVFGGVFLVVVFLTDEGKEGDLQPLWSSVTSAQHPALGKVSWCENIWEKLHFFIPILKCELTDCLQRGRGTKLSKNSAGSDCFSSQCSSGFQGFMVCNLEKCWGPQIPVGWNFSRLCCNLVFLPRFAFDTLLKLLLGRTVGTVPRKPEERLHLFIYLAFVENWSWFFFHSPISQRSCDTSGCSSQSVAIQVGAVCMA